MSKNDLVEAGVVDTRVGGAVLVKGDIEGDGNVIVEGRVEGTIAIKGDLHVAPDGQVKSAVSARNVFVQGILVGPATVLEKVEIAAGGRVVGDIKAPRFLINEGALYKGKVEMVGFEPGEPGMEQARSNRPTSPQRRAQPSQIARARTVPEEPFEEGAPARFRRGSSSEHAPDAFAPSVVRPPEFVGVKKAIIIKKKSEESAQG